MSALSIALIVYGVLAIALDMRLMSLFGRSGREYALRHRALCYAWPVFIVVAAALFLVFAVTKPNDQGSN